MFVRIGIDRSSAAALLLAIGVCCGPAEAQTATHPPGHLRTALATRTATAPVVDGAVDDAVWAAGAVTDGFWISDKGQSPSDQTRVVVLFDDQALYFAFTCLDRVPGLISATQITRDASPGFDDRVTVELDPLHNHRSISRFTVTASGTQSDVRAGEQNQPPEGRWQAAARRTASGWTAELVIPFELLGFDPYSDTFGISFVRYQNRTGERSEWSAPGSLAAMQYVAGSAGLAAHSEPKSQMNGAVDLRNLWNPPITSMVSARSNFREFFNNREVFQTSRIDSFDIATNTFGRIGRIDHYKVGILAITDSSTGRTEYVSHVVREVGPAFNVSATAVGKDEEAARNTTLQVQAGGRVGRHVQMKAAMARTSTDGTRMGMRGRGELGYGTQAWRSGAWLDYTASDFMPVTGFLAADVIGTAGRGAYTSYTRPLRRFGMRRADASVSYDVRDTTLGLRQREMASISAGGETAGHIQVNASMALGDYRRRTADHKWAPMLSDDRFYTASAFYNSPSGLFGGGANYSQGVTGVQEYASISPNVWLAPNRHFSLAYSFERATYDPMRQHVVSGTWQISGAQSVSGRWVDYDGGYYRLAYRRSLDHHLDAFGAYTSDPYNSARFTAKLVWTLLR